MKLASSHEVFKALRKVLALPDNVIRMSLKLELGELALVEILQHGTLADGAPEQKVLRRFVLQEQEDQEPTPGS